MRRVLRKTVCIRKELDWTKAGRLEERGQHFVLMRYQHEVPGTFDDAELFMRRLHCWK